MSEEPTTVVVQRYPDALAGDAPAEPIVRELLERAACRLERLCATMLHRRYRRLTGPPTNLETAEMLGGVARVLASMGRLEEARVAWQEVLADDPPEFDSWDGYAQLCAYIGNEEAYRGACKDLLDRFGGRSDHWTTDERIGVACLILPSTGGPLRRACDLAERAVRVGPKFPDPDHAYIQFVQGLAEYRRGRHERAIPVLSEASDLLPNRPGPRLVLAMAQFRSGSPREARRSLAAAAQAYNWSASQANHATAWTSHVLRREAEGLILPDLPAFLRGDHRPRDNDERLAMLGACQAADRPAAAARLYAEAYEADGRELVPRIARLPRKTMSSQHSARRTLRRLAASIVRRRRCLAQVYVVG